MKSLCIITLFLWINALHLSGQSLINLPEANYAAFIPEPATFQKSKTNLKNTSNEIVMSLYVFFDVYKNYFSSQDLNSCSFYPSCSTYGLQSIQKRGVVMGMMQTFDRLSRCHGFAPELYEIDYIQRLQIDKP
jgi:putative component of membrane protein insertase Oxa1/YidC/SpoIIIJ protein YidD